jgi:hypothetical protein
MLYMLYAKHVPLRAQRVDTGRAAVPPTRGQMVQSPRSDFTRRYDPTSRNKPRHEIA